MQIVIWMTLAALAIAVILQGRAISRSRAEIASQSKSLDGLWAKPTLQLDANGYVRGIKVTGPDGARSLQMGAFEGAEHG